jgi:Protein of unknown function (DUF732)
MFSGITRATVAAIGVLSAAAILPGATSVADPSQDQKFFDLLGEKDIPPVDNANSLIATARKACSKLDGGMSVGDLADLIRNNGYNENPLTRLNPPDRITRTINQFITASVEAYCPYDRGKIASIAGYSTVQPGTVNAPVTSRNVVFTAFVRPIPSGEILPTKPFPIPAQPPPEPQEVQPVPQAPPPPPQRVQPLPQHEAPQHAAPPVEPPPAAPPVEPPQVAPPVEPPAAPAPPPAAGGGTSGGDAPASPTPDQPAPPGHIRIAP